MHGMIEPNHLVCTLENELDGGVVPQHCDFGAPFRDFELKGDEIGCVVEHKWWRFGEFLAKDAGDLVEVGLEDVDGRDGEADVVHGSREAGPVGASAGLARAAREEVDGDGGGDAFVDLLRDYVRVEFGD